MPTNFKTIRKICLVYLGFFCVILFNKTVTAHIVPDKALPQNSLVTVSDNTIEITGGTRAWNNLYHSFQQFSTSTGSSTFFNNALDIQNIINRVTGKSISNIDGLIKANGIANLFLINSNGIIFGKDARLDIGGSKGDRGDLILDTKKLSLTGGSGIATVTRGLGKSSNLIVNASDSVLIKGFTSRNPSISSTISNSIYSLPTKLVAFYFDFIRISTLNRSPSYFRTRIQC